MDAEGQPAWDSLDHPLDRISVSALTTSINELVALNVDLVVHSNERVPTSVLQPLVRRIKNDMLSPATLYALLASRLHFKQESRSDPGNAKLWRTRWLACEELALVLVAEYDESELAQFLVYEFYPLADGTNPLETIPTWLRVSALELAIKSEAKRLLAHPVCVQIIAALWDGHLVLDPYVHKVHRSEHLQTKWDLWRLTNARKGVVMNYSFESTTVFKPSRLRVPKYRDWLKMLNLAILIAFFALAMNPSPLPYIDLAFQIWLLSFIFDELQVLNAVGTHLYFMTLWSLCDFATMALGLVYLALQLIAVVSDAPALWKGYARDVLAICGVTLIPRIFSVLEASVGFSRTVISVRRMIAELLWCWVAIMMFSVGFWAALAHFGTGLFSRTEVFYDLVQIMFGFTPAVWQTWHQYPAPGAMILFLYLFMAQFVVTTIVTAALSAKVVETKDNSLEEYHFLNAVRAEVRIKSERQVLYFYSQPFNILCFFPLPLIRSAFPTTWYLKTNRALLKLTHWHIFLAIYAYERVSSALSLRREKLIDLQQQQVSRHVRSKISKRSYRLRPAAQSSSQTPQQQIIEAVGGGSLRDKKFELVENLLSIAAPSSSANPAGHSVDNPRRLSQAASQKHGRRRNWSFDSDREIASVAAQSEDFIDPQDLSEMVRDLQQSNTRTEEMLERVLTKLQTL